MSTSTLESNELAANEGFAPYRNVSKAAVVSAVLGVLSFGAFGFPQLIVLSVTGLLMGIIGYRTVRRYPQEYAGALLGLGGAFACAITLIGATALHSFVYATEVPDGYTRLSFRELQPDPKRRELPVSPLALDLNEKKVFIKGYLYPDGQQSEIQQFVLIPDLGTCCFGGQPKLTNMVEVTLEDPLRVNFNRRKRRFGGELRVDTNLKEVAKLTGVYYQLKADYSK